MFIDIDEAFSWIESFTNLEKNTKDRKRKYRSERMKVLLDSFGNPQNEYKIIHLAGSKGKGSTSVLISSALTQLGVQTGLYTSPHVLHYRERIQINGSTLPDSEYIETADFMRRNLVSGLPGNTEPTTFELLTLMSFLIFKKNGCHWCVVETGLGGRLDATNALSPEAVVLTPIEKEHTQWLGKDLISIASEKAGIIKPKRPVFSAPQSKEVEILFRNTARALDAPFQLLTDIVQSIDSEIGIGGTRYSINYIDKKSIHGSLNLIGQIQVWNAALALQTLTYLFPDVDLSIWLIGFQKAYLPARMEVLSSSPLIVCDGAHTPRSISLALTTFQQLIKSQKERTLLFACQDDKEIHDIAGILAREFSSIVITKPGFFKQSHPSRTFEVFSALNRNSILEENPAAALELCIGKKNPLLIIGSFFLAGEILRIYRGNY